MCRSVLVQCSSRRKIRRPFYYTRHPGTLKRSSGLRDAVRRAMESSLKARVQILLASSCDLASKQSPLPELFLLLDSSLNVLLSRKPMALTLENNQRDISALAF